MAIQYSTGHRATVVTDINTVVGTNAIIKIWTGSPPATCATADTGTLLVTFAGNASAFGVVTAQTLNVSAIANATTGNAGTAGYFRVYPSGGSSTSAIIQGTCTNTGGGGDMTMSNNVFTSPQSITFSGMSITAFGA